MKKLFPFLYFFALFTGPLAFAPPDTAFRQFELKYFFSYWRWSPTAATSEGVSGYDTLLEDRSRVALGQRARDLKELSSELEALQTVSAEEELDKALLGQRIKAELLRFEGTRDWQTNPNLYADLAGQGLGSLVNEGEGSAKERLEAALSRLGQVPSLFKAMRDNLKDARPPRQLTDLALDTLKGTREFYSKDALLWARKQGKKEPALLAEFEKLLKKTLPEIDSAQKWMEAELLPRSDGSFALGERNYLAKLSYEENVHLNLPDLRRMASAQLARDQAERGKLSGVAFPDLSLSKAIEAMRVNHPKAEDLVGRFRQMLSEVNSFVTKRKIVPIPSRRRPGVRATPAYEAEGSFAFMDPPFFYVSVPSPDQTPAQKENQLRFFNDEVMWLTTMHEALPGHFLQSLYWDNQPSLTRRKNDASTTYEGHAHLMEQLVPELGFHEGDTRLRFAQSNMAVLRDVRFLASLGIHTEGMTLEQAQKLFEDVAMTDSDTARKEALRAAMEPEVYAYTLGKVLILEVRQAYKDAVGDKFKEADFWKEFLSLGPLPIADIREALLKKAGVRPAVRCYAGVK